MQKKIGIVIPCFNEAKRLDPDYIKQYISENMAWLKIVLVDDGSSDNTKSILKKLCQDIDHPCVSYLSLSINQGKAEAVRFGINHLIKDTSIDLIGFWDADMSTPLEAIADMAMVFETHPQLQSVIGSRVMLCGRDIKRRNSRHYISRIFVTVVSLFFNLSIYDSQCGAKLFKSSALSPATNRCFRSRWLFDIELFLRLRQQFGITMGQWLYELPLTKWHDKSGSKVGFFVFCHAMLDVFRIYRQYKKGTV